MITFINFLLLQGLGSKDKKQVVDEEWRSLSVELRIEHALVRVSDEHDDDGYDNDDDDGGGGGGGNECHH